MLILTLFLTLSLSLSLSLSLFFFFSNNLLTNVVFKSSSYSLKHTQTQKRRRLLQIYDSINHKLVFPSSELFGSWLYCSFAKWNKNPFAGWNIDWKQFEKWIFFAFYCFFSFFHVFHFLLCTSQMIQSQGYPGILFVNTSTPGSF